jgi:CDP-glycerol glycerophosphotransferase (TagB/SpsB family)
MIEQVAANYSIIATAHPRLQERVEYRYRDLSEKFGRQFEWTEDADEIIRWADVLSVDNSSLGFEFMAVTDRPVVWLNSPLYREQMNHGLRFWEWADSGVQVNHRANWVDGIREALEDHPAQKARRRECVQHVYGHTLDGRAAERAGDAIIEWAMAHDTRYPVED